MNDQTMKFRLGVFVLGAAILLAVLIILFGEFPLLFTRQYSYTVRFTEAPGVEEGTPVRKSGVRIGQVSGIELDADTGEVTIRITVDGKYQLRKADRPMLGRSILLGDTAINFMPEGKDREPAPDGHAFAGKAPADIREALGKAGDLVETVEMTLAEVRSLSKTVRELAPDVRRTTDEVQTAARGIGRAAERADLLIQTNQDRVVKTIDRVAELAGRAADLLNEENQRNFNATLKSLRTASDRFDALAKNAEIMMEDTRKAVKSVNDNISAVSKNADGLIGDTRAAVKSVNERVDLLAKNADALMSDTRKVVQSTGDRIDRVGQSAEVFLKDGQALVKDAQGSLKRVNETIAKGDEVLNNLQSATRPIAERVPGLIKSVEDSVTRFNQVAVNAGEFSRRLVEGDGTVQRLVSDPALYNGLNETVNGVNRSMRQLDKVFRDLAVFSDKIARHPELLGLGGAVSPSAGLKESPVYRPGR